MAGGGDMKDIDDIYDMENYDSDDSPGEFTIVVIILHCYYIFRDYALLTIVATYNKLWYT